MNPWRRRGRWLRRALFIYVIYLLIGFIFAGISPYDATFHLGRSFAQYRPLLLQMIFLMFVLIIQFAGLFWFMARGTDRKSTRLNSSHLVISYAVFGLIKNKKHSRAV